MSKYPKYHLCFQNSGETIDTCIAEIITDTKKACVEAMCRACVIDSDDSETERKNCIEKYGACEKYKAIQGDL